MRAGVLLLLALAGAGCAGPAPPPVATSPAFGGEAPRVTIGGNFRGYYGAIR